MKENYVSAVNLITEKFSKIDIDPEFKKISTLWPQFNCQILKEVMTLIQ